MLTNKFTWVQKGLLGAGLLLSGLTQALEISVGDYEPLPDQLNLAIVYLNTTSSSSLYADGKEVDGDFQLDTNVALLRVLHNIELPNGVMMEPQVVIPYGSVSTSGDQGQALGDSDGLGDIVLGLPFKWTLDNGQKDVFALAPFVYVPTGDYDKDRAVNFGENRWRFLLQSTYIKHFNEKWALDSAVDVTYHTTNDSYMGNSEEKKSLRYELQSYLRYAPSGKTMFGLGLGHINGAETEVDDVKQDNALATTYFRATASHFVAPDWQLQGLLGKDLKVEQGFKQGTQFQLRIVKVF
ncbi:transporter [Oceanobacter kriegii]|uniref:transporter n=1 Tax=Oceanobacter kriegii TaxID=64972 RepID=UPI00040244C3|nr:transporter [Oceanobacter kriegii]